MFTLKDVNEAFRGIALLLLLFVKHKYLLLSWKKRDDFFCKKKRKKKYIYEKSLFNMELCEGKTRSFGTKELSKHKIK